MKQIETCKLCTKQTFNSQQGILCSLTNAKPTFETNCTEFEKDEKQLKKEASIIKEYLPNEKLVKSLLFVFGLVICFQLLEIISNYMQYDLLQSALNGENISTEDAESNDLRHLFIVSLNLLTYITSAILFIVWFYRSYKNLHSRIDHGQFKNSWAIWGWIVPIASLYIPYQIMKEMYLDIKAQLVLFSDDYSKSDLTVFIGWWWAAWILASTCENISARIFKDQESIQGIMNYTVADMISGILMVISALVTFRMIKEFTQLDEKLRTIELEKVQ